MSGAEFQEREAELLTVGARRHDVVNIEEGWNHLLIPLLCLRDLEFRVGVSEVRQAPFKPRAADISGSGAGQGNSQLRPASVR